MKTHCTALQAWFAALALATAGLLSSGCDDDTATAAKPDASATFKSVKPGSGASNSGGEKADAGTSAGGAPQDDSTKVEEGDVAKLVGKTLYVLNQWRGLQIVDLQDPAKPKLQARVAMTGVPREMYIDGSEAIVALSQVAQLGAQDGKPLAQAGSQIRRVSLGAAPKETASLAIPGYIAATKRIGNKLIVIAPQISWNPWWYGCWGPYGCMDAAGGGVKTGTATAGASDAASSGASIAYPGGYYYGGYNADKTKVVVVDLANAAALAKVAEVEIDGGVLASSIEIGEVLIASQQWAWKDSSGTQTERLSQILLGSDGKLTLGAIAKLELPYKSDSSQSMISAHRLAAGRLAIGRQSWQAGKNTYAVESWQVQAGAWKKTAAWQKDAGPYGARLVVDGSVALFATSDYASKDDPGGGSDDGTEPSPGTDKADAGSSEPAVDGGSATTDAGTEKPDGGVDTPDVGTDKPWGAAIGLDVLDLADPATISLASHATVTSGGWDLWAMQLTALDGDRWLLTRRGYSYSEVELQVLELADPKLPQWLGKLKITSDYGMQAEVLSAQLLAVPVMTKTGGGQVGVQLISLTPSGDLAARGIFASSYIYWYQLKNLLADQTLLRIANAGLEVVDLANLDLPKVLGTLELAANVVDTAALGDRLVTLVSSWKDNKFWLRVLPVGGTDELNPEGQIAVEQQWGRLYASGNLVYVANGQTVQVYDLTDPKNPKARGKFVQDSGAYNYWDDGKSLWWNTWDMPQKGTTLYVIGQQVEYTKASGAACNPSSGGGSSGGGSSGGSGEVPATDASAPAPEPADAGATDPDLPDASGSDKEPIDAGSPDADEKPIEDGYSGTCWINPVYTTKIAALDLSDPDNPKLGGTLDLKGVGWTQDAQVTGNVLALTHYQSLQGSDGAWYGSYWLDRVDITAAAAPKLLDQTNIPGWLVGLSADGKSAVTLDWQLQAGTKPEDSKVVNTLNAVTLAGGKATLKKSVALTSQAGATLRHGDAVYVSTWPYWWNWPAAESAGTPINTELLVFDASDPAKFAQSASLQSGAGVSSLQVAGKHLFAQTAAGLGLTVWGLANPTQPVYQSFLPAQGGWGARVVALGGQAYIPAGWYGISAYPLQ